MIIETLYMYYRNSSSYWKTEKFWLFILCSVVFSTVSAVIISVGLENVFKVEDTGVLVWSFMLIWFSVWSYWIYRWCWWVRMDGSCQVHSKDGWIGKKYKPTRAEVKEDKRKERQNEIDDALDFITKVTGN